MRREEAEKYYLERGTRMEERDVRRKKGREELSGEGHEEGRGREERRGREVLSGEGHEDGRGCRTGAKAGRGRVRYWNPILRSEIPPAFAVPLGGVVECGVV